MRHRAFGKPKTLFYNEKRRPKGRRSVFLLERL
jgi:hypothetical protein